MRFLNEDGMDPALEIWVDEDRTHAIVRLLGALDRTTRVALLSFVDDLITEGVQLFVVDAGQAEITDASGATALAQCQRRVRDAGGALRWDGVDFTAQRSRTARREVPIPVGWTALDTVGMS